MTIDQKKDLALFLAGAQAWHALTHLTLAIARTDEPHRSFGIRMTRGRNWAAAGVFAGLALLFGHYGLRRSERRLPAQESGRRVTPGPQAHAVG